MKTLILTMTLLMQGCYLATIPAQSDEPTYKYNPIEMRYEITYPDSKLRYNVFENEYQYVK
jgi:hypothetical protein